MRVIKLTNNSHFKEKLSRRAITVNARRFLLFCILIILCNTGYSASRSGEIYRPVISIIIDDLGDALTAGMRAIDLPYALTYSILPHTPHAITLAKLAQRQDKEVFLHLPMQPDNDAHMGPGGLTTKMDEVEFLETLRSDLDAVPYIVGINNHMGSLLTQQSQQMKWLMRELKSQRNLVFVDSYTSNMSIALREARNANISSAVRDVFLDHDKEFENMEFYFQLLLNHARKTGSAIGIAHPHARTLDFLAKWLPKVSEEGVRIVSVRELLEIRQRRDSTWQASLSPSPRAVKN